MSEKVQTPSQILVAVVINQTSVLRVCLEKNNNTQINQILGQVSKIPIWMVYDQYT